MSSTRTAIKKVNPNYQNNISGVSLSQNQQNMQFYQPDQDNLKSYITDLKKAAVGNKKTRG